MAIRINIEFDGNSVKLDRMVKKLGDLSEFNSDAALLMEAGYKEYFARGAGPDGAWAPLAPSTIAQKGSSKILWDTGQMLNSASTDFNATSATLRQSASYAIYSQTGTSRQPARKHVGFSPELQERIKNAFRQYVSSLT